MVEREGEKVVLSGFSSGNGVPRELCVKRKADGKVYFWIHSPGSEKNGWDIYVNRKDLFDALRADDAK
jgi:hypothetical protein